MMPLASMPRTRRELSGEVSAAADAALTAPSNPNMILPAAGTTYLFMSHPPRNPQNNGYLLLKSHFSGQTGHAGGIFRGKLRVHADPSIGAAHHRGRGRCAGREGAALFGALRRAAPARPKSFEGQRRGGHQSDDAFA